MDKDRPRRHLIREENAKPGTTDWLVMNARVDPTTWYRSPWIEGYCSRTSVRAGETVEFKVSTNPPATFVLDLYRLGYYDGKGGRHVAWLGPFRGSVQRDPPIGEERLRECAWETTAAVVIPADWPSGVYLGKLTREKEKLQSYVVFIVRDDRACDYLFQCSDTTWSAYNRWPSEWSLYNDATRLWSWVPNVRVSFDRPYGKYCQVVDTPLSLGSGEFLLWEFPIAYWMEAEGYDVSYISNVDTHADPEGLLRARALLSVGHDEYWTLDMYASVKAAIAEGLNVAFLSGNSCYGVIPLLPSTAGAPHRVITRLGRFGPIEDRMILDYPEYRLYKIRGPRDADLVGAGCGFAHINVGADWICVNEKHWILEGTGMRNGEGIPGLVGWETQGDLGDIGGLEIVARGRVVNNHKVEGTYAATVYPGPKGNFVFNAATIWWGDGLSAPPGYKSPAAWGARPRGPDPRVQRITKNVLDRFRGGL